MEEPSQGSQGAEDRSQKTAAALRALREGLGTKLDAHRRRISDLETDLNTRVLQIAEELAQEQAAEAQAELSLQGDHLRKVRESLAERESTIIKLQRQISDAELKQLRLSAELAESRSAIEAVRIEECQDCVRLRADLVNAQTRVETIEEDLEQLLAEIERSSQALAISEQALVSLQQTKCQQCASFQNELAESQSQNAAVTEQLQEITGEYKRVSQELINSRQALESLRVAECDECTILRTELAEAQVRFAAADLDVHELKQIVDRTEQDLASAKQQLAALRENESQENQLLRTDLRDAQDGLESANNEIQELKHQLEISKQELAQSQKSLDDLQDAECSDCSVLRAELTEALQKAIATDTHVQELLGEVENSRKLLVESRKTLDDLRNAKSDDSHELENQLAILQSDAACSGRKLEDLESQVAQLTLDLAESRDAQSQLLAQHSADESALTESRSAAEEAHVALSSNLSDMTSERDALAEQLAEVQAELTARDEADASELSWLEMECESAEQGRKLLAAELEELLKQNRSTEQSLQDAQLKSEQAVALLQAAEEKILMLSDSTAHEEALEQAQKKFELALADAQKLKRVNAELQQELQGRPEKSEAESPELVSLRVERDALASRVAQLEAVPAPVVDHDSEQQFSDLRRRFELAVDDLRHLKQENAQLQEKLDRTSHEGGAGGHSHGTAMDWQSQKARLLATLESEDEEGQTAQRREERTTIEGTISITDRIVADKDREIAELREELADASASALAIASVETEVVNKDELIQAERAKLETLQKEMHDKLRTAEMEMSIQRAALARREAELQQKLQAAEQTQTEAPVGSDGKPRRKWLSALGIRDDDEKK